MTKLDKATYILISIISSIIFCSIYGINILNPCYTDWLLNSGDLTQHYIGWKSYRNASWTFPIGMTEILTYPIPISVIFTDSIPIFAFFFKIISPILPKNFQYFGFFGLMCFILQGIISAKILARYTNNKILIILSSILLLYTPIMLWRMYIHTALAGQWIILLALMPIFIPELYKETKKILLHTLLIGILSSSIHMYFVFMNGIILIGNCLNDFMIYKNYKRTISILSVYLLSSLSIISIFGGFSQGSKLYTGANDLNKYSFNLNALYNPQDWSCIFKSLPTYKTGQYEGFAYLGFGILILLTLAIIILIFNNSIKESIKKQYSKIISLSIIAIISIFISLSPTITFNNNVLASFQLPESIVKIWSIFRVTGRTCWIAVYIIILCSCIIIFKSLKNKLQIAIFIMILICLFQIFDIHKILIEKNKQFNKIAKYNSSIDENFWNNIVKTTNAKHIVFTYINPKEKLEYALGNFVTNNSMTLSNFNIARIDSIKDRLKSNINKSLSKITDKNIYIFKHEKDLHLLNYNLNYYQVDDYIVGYIEQIKNYDKIPIEELKTLTYKFAKNKYILNNTEKDTKEGRILYPNGLSFGPYWYVPGGKYKINVVGSNLKDKIEINITSNLGKKK